MILVDTSVIADIFTRDPEWFAWSSAQMSPIALAHARSPQSPQILFFSAYDDALSCARESIANSGEGTFPFRRV